MSRIVTQSLFHSSRVQPSWRSYLVSSGVHLAITALLLAITIPVARQQFQEPTGRMVLLAPTPVPPSYSPPPKIVVRNTPPPRPLPRPLPRLVKPVEQKRPLIATAPVMPVIKNPDPVLHPLAELKPEPPVELAKKVPAAPQVSVGGFGDPNGVPPSHSKPTPVMMAKVGSFDLPNGSGQAGGSGHDQSGAIHESGFGTVGAASGHTTDNGSVRTGAFADPATSPLQHSKTPEVTTPVVTPVEILFKPKPAYTAEARTLRLEGQVSLQVVFLSTGSIRVVRVVHGLGHGLDEAAQQAALQVRFKPATRGGVAVDTNATINITFELT